MDASMQQEPVYNALGYRYAGAVIFFIAMQWIAAVGRIGVRTIIVRKFGWDDIFTIITLILSTGFDAIFLVLIHQTHGGAADMYIPFQNLISSINLVLALVCTFVVGTACLKVACGLLLLRVLVKPWQAWTIYSAMTITILYSLYCFFFTLFECGDPQYFHIKILIGQCMSNTAINATTYTHSVLIAVIDCLFAALPIALIWNTDMSRRSKISVVAVLGIGSLAAVCTFVRIGYVHSIIQISEYYFSQALPLALLSAAELSIGVTCISICTYKPLFHRYLWKTGYYYGAGNDEYGAPDGVQQIRDPFGSNASVDFADPERSPTKRSGFADTWPRNSTILPSAFGQTAPLQPTQSWPLQDTTPTASPISPVSPIMKR